MTTRVKGFFFMKVLILMLLAFGLWGCAVPRCHTQWVPWTDYQLGDGHVIGQRQVPITICPEVRR